MWPATGLRSSVHGEEDPQVGICREEGVRKVGSGRKRVGSGNGRTKTYRNCWGLRHSAVSQLMLTSFPSMTLMAALPELLKFASG